MATRHNLREWVVQALKAHNGRATLLQISKFIWNNYESELKASGDLFYTWQYDMRWAAMTLRKDEIMLSAEDSPHGVWELA